MQIRPILSEARALALILGALLGAPALAAPVAGNAGAELIFGTDQLDGIATGTVIAYAHARRVPDPTQFPEIVGGEISIELTPPDPTSGTAREAIVRMNDGRRTRQLEDFPADSGNPVVVTFLESSVNAMAKLTGGSPFYIRNRVKDALAKGADIEEITAEVNGAPVQVTRIVYRPFDGDPNAGRMGQFAGLTLRFELSRDIPGHFVRLTAETAPGADAVFREDISLTKTGE